MNIKQCPKCESKMLYKNILEDGMAQLVCMNGQCKWKSALVDGHFFIEHQTIQAKTRDWA